MHTLWRSTWVSLGQRVELLFQHEVFNTSLQSTPCSNQYQTLAYHVVLHTDYNIWLFNGTNARTYADSHKLHDPDQPSLDEDALHHYIEAMKLKISQLTKQKSGESMNIHDVPKDKNGASYKARKGIWTLKLKRLTDGTPPCKEIYKLKELTSFNHMLQWYNGQHLDLF